MQAVASFVSKLNQCNPAGANPRSALLLCVTRDHNLKFCASPIAIFRAGGVRPFQLRQDARRRAAQLAAAAPWVCVRWI